MKIPGLQVYQSILFNRKVYELVTGKKNLYLQGEYFLSLYKLYQFKGSNIQTFKPRLRGYSMFCLK